MSRTVMTYGTPVAYLDTSEVGDEWDYREYLEELRYRISDKYQSFNHKDHWYGQEGRIILENDHAMVVVCEYCGLTSISIVPTEYDGWHEDDQRMINLQSHWIDQVMPGLQSLFPERYYKTGCFSNGECVYQKAS